MSTEQDGVPVPDVFLIEIGRITVAWNTLESFLDLALIKLSGKDIYERRSYIVFAHMAFPQKLDVLGALVFELVASSPEYSRLAASLTKTKPLLKAAQDGRNWVTHSKWGADQDGTVTVSKLKARGELKATVDPVTLESVQKVSSAIKAALDSLYELVMGKPVAQSLS